MSIDLVMQSNYLNLWRPLLLLHLIFSSIRAWAGVGRGPSEEQAVGRDSRSPRIPGLPPGLEFPAAAGASATCQDPGSVSTLSYASDCRRGVSEPSLTGSSEAELERAEVSWPHTFPGADPSRTKENGRNFTVGSLG